MAITSSNALSEKHQKLKTELDILQAQLLTILHPTMNQPDYQIDGSLPLSTTLNLEQEAKRIVDRHIQGLHIYNECRDAVQNLIQKYAACTGKQTAEILEILGLERED